MKHSAKRNFLRVTVDTAPEDVARLQELETQSIGGNSKRSIFLTGLRLLCSAIRARKAGFKLQIANQTGEPASAVEALRPFLDLNAILPVAKPRLLSLDHVQEETCSALLKFAYEYRDTDFKILTTEVALAKRRPPPTNTIHAALLAHLTVYAYGAQSPLLLSLVRDLVTQFATTHATFQELAETAAAIAYRPEAGFVERRFLTDQRELVTTPPPPTAPPLA